MQSIEKKKVALKRVAELRTLIEAGNFTKKSIASCRKAAVDAVKASIDHLLPVKSSTDYTFESSLKEELDRYFFYEIKNPKEEARFARQTAKREALIARGKTVDWKVVPKHIVDLNELKSHILGVLDDLKANYEDLIANAGTVDFRKISVDLIDYFKEKASLVVYKITRSLARKQAIDLMEEVGIPEPRIRFKQYPFEFSGGMRQRIVIAIALAANPDILICDEPTTALDVTIQAQILELINKLKAERKLSVIFITHDLGVVANMADRVAVMYAGKIVEYGTANDIFYSPAHPYTWALLSSMPDLDTNEKLEAIPGTPPNMIYPPKGDAFAERNKYAMQIDFEEQPPLFRISESHYAATWLLHPDAPKVDPPKMILDRIERMKKKEETDNG
ncbi:MAG: ABC transporter ATP-binding protein [Clostridia bacterium]|nr:ABC transporter ATP-binding protein [Clostridia bacterium]